MAEKFGTATVSLKRDVEMMAWQYRAECLSAARASLQGIRAKDLSVPAAEVACMAFKDGKALVDLMCPELKAAAAEHEANEADKAMAAAKAQAEGQTVGEEAAYLEAVPPGTS